MRKLEVHWGELTRNFDLCRARVGQGVGVIPVIKANAYGHGAVEVARLFENKPGVEFFAVALAEEGTELRRAGIRARIIVLAAADFGDFKEVYLHRLEPAIYNFNSLNGINSELLPGSNYPIHIKLDTGMHRMGFTAEQVSGVAGVGDDDSLITVLREMGDRVRVATIFSHLAAADDPAQDDFTRGQIAEFERVSSLIETSLGYPVRRHLANTSGIERFPEARFDMVRLGLGLYGFGLDGARQAMTLKTDVVNVARLPAGSTVGYNRQGVLKRDSTIATLSIGYADGIDRRLSNGRWSVWINGREAPIVGNVCMDSLMVDVTDLEDTGVAEGSVARVISQEPGNTVADMAARLGTIPYEVMTGIAERVKRDPSNLIMG